MGDTAAPELHDGRPEDVGIKLAPVPLSSMRRSLTTALYSGEFAQLAPGLER